MSVPNQKTIIIHQSDQIPFLKIGIEELMDAYKTIRTPSSFVLYLYLASNKDGYKLELSKEAFANATGYSKSSYHRAVDQLTKLGYIYEDNCGRLNFGTRPKEGARKAIQNWEEEGAKLGHPIVKNETAESQNCNASLSEMNTEINNRDNKEQQIIDTTSPLFKYISKSVSPSGQFLNGKHKGKWLERMIPNFWGMSKEEQVTAITKNTCYKYDAAQIIVYHVLDLEEHERMMKLFKRVSSIRCSITKSYDNILEGFFPHARIIENKDVDAFFQFGTIKIVCQVIHIEDVLISC